MYCRTCGNKMNENAEICVKCGVKRNVGNNYCQICGAKTDESMSKCSKCGAILKKSMSSVQLQKEVTSTGKKIIGKTLFILGLLALIITIASNVITFGNGASPVLACIGSGFIVLGKMLQR